MNSEDFSKIGLPLPDAIFEIQNVADYFYQIHDEYIDYNDDIFSFRLPFPITAFTFKMPRTNRVKGKIEQIPFAGEKRVIIARELQISENDFYVVLSLSVVGIGKIYALEFFCDRKGIWSPCVGERFPHEYFHPLIPTSDYEKLSQDILPALLALNFLNCKNIEVEERVIDDKLRKRREKKGKTPFIKTYTLEITAIKKALDAERQHNVAKGNSALHFCRGHFKDYRETGVFGKNKGVYWWPAVVRGSKAAGTINKDYKTIGRLTWAMAMQNKCPFRAKCNNNEGKACLTCSVMAPRINERAKRGDKSGKRIEAKGKGRSLKLI